MKKIVTFNDFKTQVFPHHSPFDRKNLGFITNLIKYLALYTAYFLYKSRISANFLNIFGLVITTIGFFILYNSIIQKDLIFFCIGYSLLAFTIFIDFIDGPLAKASKYIYTVGSNLDNLCPDIILIGGMLIIGVISQSTLFFILISINSVFYITYVSDTIKKLQFNENLFIVSLISSRYSLYSIRVFISGILPLICVTNIYSSELSEFLAKILISVYIVLSLIWLRKSFEVKTSRKMDE